MHACMHMHTYVSLKQALVELVRQAIYRHCRLSCMHVYAYVYVSLKQVLIELVRQALYRARVAPL